MYLLYLDESGNENDPNDRYFVLGGVALFERQTYFLFQAVIRSPARGRMLFAVAVEKSRDLWGEAAVEKATEEICRRFDLFLTRQYHDRQDPQRGFSSRRLGNLSNCRMAA